MPFAILSIAMFAAAFAPETEKNFMNACSVGTDSSVCRCTLSKIEKQYTEPQFKNIDSQLSHGKKAPAYETFVQKSVADCRAEASQGSAAGAVAGSQASPENAAMMQLVIGMFAESFEPECVQSLNSFLGNAESHKSCSCFLEKMKAPEVIDQLAPLFMEGNEQKETDFLWSVGSVCIPEKFTPEMENNIVRQCADGNSGMSKTLSEKAPDAKVSEKNCRCVLGELEKKYTFRDMAKAAMNANDSALILYVTEASARCGEMK